MMSTKKKKKRGEMMAAQWLLVLVNRHQVRMQVGAEVEQQERNSRNLAVQRSMNHR